MTDLRDPVAVIVNDVGISLGQVLNAAQFHGDLGFLQSIVDAALIRQAASQRNIEVSDDELQAAADSFRTGFDLHKSADLLKWLADRHLSVPAWEELLEDQILVEKLRREVTDGKIEAHYAQNKLSYDAASISRIVVASEGLARELRSQIVEEDSDFHALARKHSTDEKTKPAGGYAGRVKRSDLNAAQEAGIFGAAPGTVVGPFKVEAGWELVKVEERHPAQLDDATRAHVREAIFAEWLDELRRKSRVDMPLFRFQSVEED